MHNDNHHIIEQVPPDYYQKGVKTNFFQRTWHLRKLNNVLHALQNAPHVPQRVLDVGCASGWFLSELKKQYPKAECYGIDIYDKAISFGTKKYPRMKLQVANAEKLPYRKEYFNTIICTEVLEHVDDPPQVLSEIKRVLKKDGIAIIELDSGSILFSIVWYIWRKFHGKVWNDAHLHSFTVGKLERAIKRTGFQIISTRTFTVGMAMIFTLKKK